MAPGASLAKSRIVEPVEGGMSARKRCFDQLGNDGHAVEAIGEDDHAQALLHGAHGKCLESSAIVVAPLEERAAPWFEPPAQPPGNLGIDFREVGGETLDAGQPQGY